MLTYERVKPATAGPDADTYLELKMICLFYFVLESEKSHNVRTGVVPEKDSIFSLFILSFFFISSPNGNIHPAVH